MERNKFSKRKRRAGIGRRFLTGVALLGLAGVIAIGCTMSGDESSESSVVQKVHDEEVFELDLGKDCFDKQGNMDPGICGQADTINDTDYGVCSVSGSMCMTDADCDASEVCIPIGGDDWQDVYADFIDGTPAGDNSNAFAVAFVEDTVGAAEDTFFESSTKDVQDLDQWFYDTTDPVVPDKNDIVTAFAGAYDGPGGDVYFYYGLDTFSVNGSNTAGFWFFRKPVVLGPLGLDGKGPFESPAGDPNGLHSEGDVLVVVDYSQGGSVGTTKVFKWTGGALVQQSSSNADCANVTMDGLSDDICGVISNTDPTESPMDGPMGVNGIGEDPPWNYVNKHGLSTYEQGALFEGGINISALFPDGIGCFSSFLAETRASNAPNATLKDFALGSFPVCGIEVTKTADELSKVGDGVNYTVTVENTGRATLYKQEITDSLAGDLTNAANSDCGDSLAPGATCTITYSRTVVDSDPDPVVNTVDIVYTESPDPSSLEFTASDDAETNLFQPSIDFGDSVDTGKSASPTLLLIGGNVDYTLTLKNTSSDDAPNLVCTITDTELEINETHTLMSGDTKVISASKTFLDLPDPNPFTNTADVDCSPVGFPNVLDASDSATITVIPVAQALSVAKVGPQYSKVGDTVEYTVSINNIGALDLTLDFITDSLVGNLTGLPTSTCPVAPAELASGEDCTITYEYVVEEGDDDPLLNTVTVEFSDGFGGSGTLTDGHTVDLIDPSFTVSKTCTNEPVPQDGPATFTVTIENTGDVELVVTANDGIGTFTLAASDSRDFDVSVAGPFAGQASVTNSVTASWTLPEFTGLPNSDSATASDTCIVAGEAKITKLTQGAPNEAPNPATQNWRFVLQDCGTDGCQKDDDVIGDVTSPPSMVEFGVDLVPTQLNSDQVYRLCEVQIPAAWTNTWMGDANDDGTPETLIPFVPAVSDDPVANPPGWSNVFDPAFAPPPAIWDNSERCINFVADAGATEVFEINNEFPGGEPRTIGYWKNWDSCSGGGQVYNAIANGGETPAERLGSGNALLDDVLQNPGITVGLLNMIADANVFSCDQGTQDAVNILDKRDIDSGKKKANDAAYGLAAQLLAAIANDSAGAGVCPEAGQAIIDGQLLLAGISFNGTGNYFARRVNEINDFTKQDANELAGLLDSYNNGTLCL